MSTNTVLRYDISISYIPIDVKIQSFFRNMYSVFISIIHRYFLSWYINVCFRFLKFEIFLCSKKKINLSKVWPFDNIKYPNTLGNLNLMHLG